jgi:hypothetical protein
VPRDRALGPCAHGTIGAFYFYAEGARDDPAFGFCDIEVSVQAVADGKVRLELYCIADGYQSARGVGARCPLKIAVMVKDQVRAVAEWHFADVICGHADPMNFATDLDRVNCSRRSTGSNCRKPRANPGRAIRRAGTRVLVRADRQFLGPRQEKPANLLVSQKLVC